MKILFKWDDKQTGRVERTRMFYENDVIGTAVRSDGHITAYIEIDERKIQLSGKKATVLKDEINDWVNGYYNEMVTVYNVLSNKPVEIRRGDRGGPCDPSTERYHSM